MFNCFTTFFLERELLSDLNKKQKPLVLKKNIIEKNKINHPEVSISEYNNILENAVYKPDYVLQTKPNTKIFKGQFAFLLLSPTLIKKSVLLVLV